jgi:hypothetical protein
MVWLFLFLMCAGYEVWSGLTGRLMLTPLIVKFVPWWVTLPVILWLLIHFSVRYFDSGYVAWVNSK